MPISIWRTVCFTCQNHSRYCFWPQWHGKECWVHTILSIFILIISIIITSMDICCLPAWARSQLRNKKWLLWTNFWNTRYHATTHDIQAISIPAMILLPPSQGLSNLHGLSRTRQDPAAPNRVHGILHACPAQAAWWVEPPAIMQPIWKFHWYQWKENISQKGGLGCSFDTEYVEIDSCQFHSIDCNFTYYTMTYLHHP